MGILENLALPESICQVLVELEAKGYQFDYYQPQKERTVVIFLDEVEIIDTSKIDSCDTCIYIEKIVGLKPPRDSEYAIFATLIYEGIDEKTSPSFVKALDTLNYKNKLGKFVRDYNDRPRDVLYVTNEGESYLKSEMPEDSYDILYVTNHCLTYLNSEVVESRLEYHAKMKAKVVPMLEKLKNKSS